MARMLCPSTALLNYCAHFDSDVSLRPGCDRQDRARGLASKLQGRTVSTASYKVAKADSNFLDTAKSERIGCFRSRCEVESGEEACVLDFAFKERRGES